MSEKVVKELLEMFKNDVVRTREMIGRLKTDCDYYLTHGERCAQRLWAGDEKEHIECLKALYKSLPKRSRPKWLTYEQILGYEKEMVKEVK